MVVWVIYKNIIGDTIVATAETHEDDIIIADFSLFNGPSIIRWYNYKNIKDVMISNAGDIFILEVINQQTKSTAYQIKMKMISANWNYPLECMEYQFISYVQYLFDMKIRFSLNGNTNLNAILGRACAEVNVGLRKLGVLENKIHYKTQSELSDKKFNGYFYEGFFGDIIKKLTDDYKLEYIAISDVIGVANLFATTEIYGTIYSKFNTVNRIDFDGNFLFSGVSGQIVPLPGKSVVIGRVGSSATNTSRIVYCQFHYSKRTFLCSFIASDIHFNYKTFWRLLPFHYKDQYNFPTFDDVGFGKIKEEANGNEMVLTNKELGKNEDVVKYGWDQNDNLKFRAVKSSPYAGDTVGLQFPQNKDGTEIIVSKEGGMGKSVGIGQIFQNGKEPKRDSLDDFRLTLPDGGTLYYDKSNGTWIINAKKGILIGVDNTTSSSVPTNTVNYVEINDDGSINMKGDGSLKAAARVGDKTKSNFESDATFWKFWNAFFGIINGAPTPEPGNGSPSMFDTALKAAISAVGGIPSYIDSKVSEGSSKVKMG